MEPLPRNNHVFVDCENIHQIDPTHIGAKTVKFHFLFGANQKKLDLDAVEKINKHAGSVELIRLASTGPNALDFILSYHLGRIAITDPLAYFHIVSKDKGYRPLIDHLKQNGLIAILHEDFSTLTFSARAKSATPPSPAAKPKPLPSPPHQKTASPKTETSLENGLKLARKCLKSSTPLTEAALIMDLASHLNLPAGNPTIQAIITRLQKDGYLKIDAAKEVAYHFQPKPAPAASTHA